MPKVSHRSDQPFSNFHGNRSFTVADQASYERMPGDPPASNGPEAFAASASALKPYLAAQIASGIPVGIVGAGWSLSPILGMPGAQLDTAQLDHLAAASPADLHPQCRTPASYLAFAGGGARLADLVAFAEAQDRSIKTCGSYLGTSIAGAMATSVNGSALGFGGFQNQIRGMHLITGSDRSVWIEPASDPALSDSVALTFADAIIRDDRIFADCQVHLGGMGLVNGVLFELVDKRRFGVVKRKLRVTPQWLDWISAGNFAAVAAFLGHPHPGLAYYEVQVDPFDLFGSPALHTLYFEVDQPPTPPASLPSRVYDALGRFAAHVAPQGLTLEMRGDGEADPAIPGDLFAFYSRYYFCETPPLAPSGSASWGELHGGPDPALQGKIYTAAMALPRERFAAVVPQLGQALITDLQAIGQQMRHLLYTFRFVSGAQGSLAFTHFADSVVLDMEGLMQSPLSHRAGAVTIAALEQGGERFCLHWGKLVPPSADQIEKAFGAATVGQWKATRQHLLDPEAQAVLRNQGLTDWGLA